MTVTGSVLTLGDSSAGVLTQSLGGGGGNGGVNVSAAVNLSKENGGTLGVGVGGFGGGGGNAGDVTSRVTTTTAHPQIVTTGRDSSAVVAQSIGGGGGNGGVNVTGRRQSLREVGRGDWRGCRRLRRRIRQCRQRHARYDGRRLHLRERLQWH